MNVVAATNSRAAVSPATESRVPVGPAVKSAIQGWVPAAPAAKSATRSRAAAGPAVKSAIQGRAAVSLAVTSPAPVRPDRPVCLPHRHGRHPRVSVPYPGAARYADRCPRQPPTLPRPPPRT
jgi:hypothetical protein